MLHSIVSFAVAALATPGVGSGRAAPPPPSAYVALLRRLAAPGPQIQLWTDRDDGTVYHRGDRVRVYFRTDLDAYVTIFRVDTDGRIRVLFPADPWDDNFARGGRAYEVRPTDDRYAFLLDEYPGEGFVFAIATRDPFDYHQVVRGDHWDYRVIANNGRVAGDPYVAIEDLVDMVVPPNYDAYSYDVTSYYVEQYYEYPRFLCYDCHSFVAYPYWDPYNYSCRRFRIVIYDDPYYYPARAYPATRVVYRRVARIEPRYVFKDRQATEPYVIRVRQRPAEATTRRGEDRGVTGRDIGGVGAIPAPIPEPRRAPEVGGTRGNLVPGRRPDVTSPQVPDPNTLIPGRRPQAEPQTVPRRVPETEAQPPSDRRRLPTPYAAPQGPPTRLVPQGPERREPAGAQDERPRLERREPPAAQPQPSRRPAETNPPRPQAQPQKTPPKASPGKASPTPPKPRKPGVPERRKPGA